MGYSLSKAAAVPATVSGERDAQGLSMNGQAGHWGSALSRESGKARIGP